MGRHLLSPLRRSARPFRLLAASCRASSLSPLSDLSCCALPCRALFASPVESSSDSAALASSTCSAAGVGDREFVRCLLTWYPFLYTAQQDLPPSRDDTHSSLSLRPRLGRLYRNSSPSSAAPPSLASFALLASMACLSCSSSYAASRLFIVERRFEASEAALAREALELLLFGDRDRVPSFAMEVERDTGREIRCGGWYFEYFCLTCQRVSTVN